MNIETPTNRAMCHRWFLAELSRLQALPQLPDGIVTSILLYGEDYIGRFNRFCMPSLMSTANREAIAGHTRMLVYTTEADRGLIWNLTRPLVAAGIHVVIEVLPPELTAKDLKYMALGTVHQVGFFAAGMWRAGYHLGQPDHLFSAGYFTGLRNLARQHKAIGQAAISANLLTAAPDLEQYRGTDGTLTIDSSTLGSIGHKHLHEQFTPMIANDMETPAFVPPTMPVLWRAKNKLALYGCHMNMDYVSPHYTTAAPLPTVNTCYATIDIMWPYLVPQQVPHQPALEDGMMILELSGAEKHTRESPVSLEVAAGTLWHVMRFTDDYHDLMRRRSLIPVPGLDGLDDEVIDYRQSQIFAGMLAARPTLAVRAIQYQAQKQGWSRPA